MARGAVQSESEVCAALLETYDVNDCMNQLSLEHLDARAWRASPEGKTSEKDARLPEFSPIGTTSPVLDEKLSSPPEESCAARPRAWHDQADTRSSPAKRSTMPGDAEGSSIERHLQTCDSILTRELGAQLACGNNDVPLHVRARGPSPGAGDRASTSTGLQAARQGHLWDLTVGEVSEAVRL